MAGRKNFERTLQGRRNYRGAENQSIMFQENRERREGRSAGKGKKLGGAKEGPLLVKKEGPVKNEVLSGAKMTLKRTNAPETPKSGGGGTSQNLESCGGGKNETETQ